MIKKAGRYVLIFLSLCSPAFKAQSGLSLIDDNTDKSRYYDQVDVDASVAYDMKACKPAQVLKDYRLCPTALNPAISYRNISGYKKASVCYRKEITLAGKIRDEKLLTKAYQGFGSLLALQKQYGRAIRVNAS